MKRYGNLYKEVYSINNLRLAHKNASKGKGWYQEVKEINKDPTSISKGYNVNSNAKHIILRNTKHS